MIEAGHLPPPSHHPARFPLGDGPGDGLALSLSSATLIRLNLGPALVDRLTALGAGLEPLAGLALHELLVNAVIHGNLQIGSGRSDEWADLAQRRGGIARSLADRSLATRRIQQRSRMPRATSKRCVTADSWPPLEDNSRPPE